MKKKIPIVILILIILLSSGCTKYVKNDNNKVVINENTGQNLTENILCKPSSDELKTLYEEYNNKLTIKLEELPECSNFKINSLKYSGLWESIFVKPLAYIILKLGDWVNNYGISVMIIGLIIRLIMMPISIKASKQSENMKNAQPEIAKIEKKYKDKTDSASMMAKSQETMMIYKKYNMNPVSGCITAFLQIPLFLAFLEAINRVPAIFEGSLLSFNLGTTPWVGIFSNGQYLYLILIALIVLTTYFSLKNTFASQTGEAAKQMQFMAKFMIIMISVASLRLPTAIALYWIVTNGFAIFQNLIVKRSK